MTEPSDDALAIRAGAGDREAFAELLKRHYDRIFRIGVRVLGDTEAAADLAQEVCVGLPGKLISYRRKGRFTTWLYRVVVNAARDALRRAATRRRLESDYTALKAPDCPGHSPVDGESVWLRQVLGRLSAELRTTLILVIEEGLGHAEAGKVLGVTAATVSWRMHKVRKCLRAYAVKEEVVP